MTQTVIRDFIDQTKIYVIRAYVNSFQLGDGQDAKWRHDCLLKVDDSTTQRIANYRERMLKPMIRAEVYTKLSLQPPHITHSIHDSKKSAQEQVDAINAILDAKGPRAVEIIGVTV